MTSDTITSTIEHLAEIIANVTIRRNDYHEPYIDLDDAREAAIAALELWNKVSVGRFTLWNRGIHKGKIDIVCNEKSDACGEGGEFDEAELENTIGEFYAKHF